MDFGFTEEQRILLDSLDRFLNKEIQPHVEEWDRKKAMRDAGFLKEIFAKIQPFGAIGGPVPEKYGGMDLDYVSTGLIGERVAKCWCSLWGVSVIATAAARLLAEVPNAAARAKYLPSICAGTCIPCIGITEPNVGSNPSRVQTTLKKADGGYVLNGSKTWISNGSVSDIALVLATVDRSLGMKGIGIVLVDRKETPYSTRELEKMGLKAFPTSELVFEDVFVPEANVIVPPGQGLKKTFRAFQLARSFMAVGSVGLCRAALAQAVRYSQEREQSGKKIGAFQMVQEMLADMRMLTDASALLAYRPLWMMDQDMRCETEAAVAKAYCTEAAVKVTKNCIQILGGYGLSEEFPAERYYRDASCMTIPDGTTQMQKLIIARSMTGLNAIL